MILRNEKGAAAIIGVAVAGLVAMIAVLATYDKFWMLSGIREESFASFQQKLVLSSALDHAYYAVKQRWCLDEAMMRDTDGATGRCDFKNPYNTERLLLSQATAQALRANPSVKDWLPSDSEEIILNSKHPIVRRVLLSQISKSHPLSTVVEPIKKDIESIEFTLSRNDDLTGPGNGRVAFVDFKVVLYEKSGKALSNIISQLQFYPRELNTFSLIMAGNLFVGDYAWKDRFPASRWTSNDVSFPFVTQQADADLNQKERSESRGIHFLSPVFVNRGLYLPRKFEPNSRDSARLSKSYADVTFHSSVTLGGGTVFQYRLSSSKPYTDEEKQDDLKPFVPVNPGGMESRYSKDQDHFGGLYQGVKLDSALEEGLDRLFGSTVAQPKTEIMYACIERAQIQMSLAKTDASRLMLQKINEQLTNGHRAFEFNLGLSRKNEFREVSFSQSNGLLYGSKALGSAVLHPRLSVAPTLQHITPTNPSAASKAVLSVSVRLNPSESDAGKIYSVLAPLSRRSKLTLSLNALTPDEQVKLAQEVLGARQAYEKAQSDRERALQEAQSTVSGAGVGAGMEQAGQVSAPILPTEQDIRKLKILYEEKLAEQTEWEEAQKCENPSASCKRPQLIIETGEVEETLAGKKFLNPSVVALKVRFTNEKYLKQAPELKFYSYEYGTGVEGHSNRLSEGRQVMIQSGAGDELEVYSKTATPSEEGVKIPYILNGPNLGFISNDRSFSGGLFDELVADRDPSDGNTRERILGFKKEGTRVVPFVGDTQFAVGIPTVGSWVRLQREAVRESEMVSSTNASNRQLVQNPNVPTKNPPSNLFFNQNQWSNLDEACDPTKNSSGLTQVSRDSMDPSFTESTRFSWNVRPVSLETGTDSFGEYLNQLELEKEGEKDFHIYSIVKKCIVGKNLQRVMGFLVCDEMEFEERDQSSPDKPIQMIGTFIVGKLKIPKSVMKKGIHWMTIYHPQAVQVMRQAGVLKSPFVNSGCAQSYEVPVWAPNLGDGYDKHYLNCNPLSVRNLMDPIRWTQVDPECGLVEGETMTRCKAEKRVYRFSVMETYRNFQRRTASLLDRIQTAPTVPTAPAVVSQPAVESPLQPNSVTEPVKQAEPTEPTKRTPQRNVRDSWNGKGARP